MDRQKGGNETIRATDECACVCACVRYCACVCGE